MSKIVLFGECMVELRTLPDSTLVKSFAGDTYNTSVYLKRCARDNSVSYLTAIGADFLSDELMMQMGEEEINSTLVFRSPDRNLGLYMIRNDHKGERDFAYWRSQSAATQTFNLMPGGQVECDSFYFSGISIAILDEPQRNALFSFVERLKTQGSRIVFDPNYRPGLWQDVSEARYWTDKGYAMADMAFPGGDDHLALYGHTDFEAILAHLSDKHIDEVVIKNGAVGVHILCATEQCIVPVERVNDVVDTTAAGDAFNGAYIAARLSGKKPTSAAGYAAKVAATVIRTPGAIIPKAVFSQSVPLL